MNDISATERRAQALAEISQMQTELIAAKKEVADMREDLHRAEDRVTIMIEERDRYRGESTVYRTKLVELATSMANIGLLTVKAQEIMMTVKLLTDGETQEHAEGETESARQMVKRLAAGIVPRGGDQ